MQLLKIACYIDKTTDRLRCNTFHAIIISYRYAIQRHGPASDEHAPSILACDRRRYSKCKRKDNDPPVPVLSTEQSHYCAYTQPINRFDMCKLKHFGTTWY